MKHIAVAFLVLMTAPAFAQSHPDQPQQQQSGWQSQRGSSDDEPIGSPYRTGDFGQGSDSSVPLRDYLSSRTDQLRSELIAVIDRLENQMRDIINERDRQYSQRFEAQQKTTADSLQAVQTTSAKELQATKETSANALSAAKEATTKAEDSINERLKLSNELRGALEDVGRLQMPRAEAEARLKSIEEKVGDALIRLNNISSESKGAGELWGWIVGAGGLLLAAIVFLFNATREKPIFK